MEQYIPKSALVAEIERLIKKNELYLDDKVSDEVRFQKTGAYSVLCDLRHFLDTLEVKEVDLDKEIKEVQRNYKTIEEYEGYPCTMYAGGIEWIAKHFFELGLKARKGE